MRLGLGLAASASLALLLGSVSTVAQSAPYGKATVEGIYGPSSQHTVPLYNPNSIVIGRQAGPACPVSLHAQHGADGTMLKVDKNRPAGLAQKLHLTLSNKGPRQIVAARLRVSGSSGKGQLSRTDSAQGGMNLTLNSTPSGMDLTRNVTVRLRQGDDNESIGDAWVAGMSAVLQVELSTVTYDDGSVQRFSAADGCRFRPDHLMLIADR